MQMRVLLLSILSVLLFSCGNDKKESEKKDLSTVYFDFSSFPQRVVSDEDRISERAVTEPTSKDQIDCFAVFVSYPPDMPTSNFCYDGSGYPKINASHFMGTFSRNESVAMDVIAGPNRLFTLVGFKKADGVACPKMPMPISAIGTIISSKGYILSRAYVNLLPGNQDVVMNSFFYQTNNITHCSPGVLTTAPMIACPANYLLVPPNSAVGTNRAFCVAKYEMKCEGFNCSTACADSCDVTDQRLVTSKPNLLPWISISRNKAIAACNSLNAINGTTKYSLITNAQWQTIARNIEAGSQNWSGRYVGGGMLNRGHSDSVPSNLIPASSNDSDSYIGTNNTSADATGSGWEQKRTHKLSTGEIIWDFAGNAWEWVLGDFTTKPNSGEFSTIFDSTLRKQFAPLNASYGFNQGVGKVYNVSTSAAIRGGGFGSGIVAGVYGLSFELGALGKDIATGFRCVYNP